jgi:hypothetical protein
VLDVDPGRVLKPTLKLREMFRAAAAAPPGSAGGRGLISEMHASAAAAGRSAVEEKKYQDALTAQQAQQRRVNDLLKGFAAVPASPTADPSNPDTKAHAYSTSFLKNTVEWIEKKIIPLYVLTPTHYSDVVYFDNKVAYPEIGGTYDPDLNKQAQDPNVVPVGNPAELGEAHVFRDEYNKSAPMSAASHIYLFVGRDEQLTMERLSATLEHEVQHIADFSPTIPAVAGQLDLNSVKQLYEGVVAGQNVVNSVRIEELLENVRACSKTLSAGDTKLAAVEDAARKLDAVDGAFLKDRTQAKPFWDVLNDRLPPFEVGKVTELAKP